MSANSEASLAAKIEEVRERIRLRPNDAELHGELGYLYTLEEEWEGARDAYRQAIRLDAADAISRYNLACALLETGETEEAIYQLREAIRVDPTDSEYHRILGQALDANGELEAAEEACRTAVRLKPDNERARCDLARVLYAQRKFEEAVSEGREAVRLLTEETSLEDRLAAYWGLALTLRQIENYNESHDAFRQAIRLQPNNRELIQHLGMLLDDQGFRKFVREQKAKPIQDAVDEIINAFLMRPHSAQVSLAQYLPWLVEIVRKYEAENGELAMPKDQMTPEEMIEYVQQAMHAEVRPSHPDPAMISQLKRLLQGLGAIP